MDNSEIRALADETATRLHSRDPTIAARQPGGACTLPAGGIAEMEANVDWAADALRRLSTVDAAILSTEDRRTAAFLGEHFRQEVAEAERFWFRFPVTPYNASVLSTYRDIMARNTDLLPDYLAAVSQMRQTLAAQRRRGIVLPAPAKSTAIDGISAHAAASPEETATEFSALLDEISAHDGPDTLGLCHQPGGAECYAGLVRCHTGLDLTPEAAHQLGLSEVDRLTAQSGIADEDAHRARLAADPRLYATDPADLHRRLQSYVDRLGDHLDACFASLPSAPFRLRRLDAELEADLTYGYYEPPGADGCGYFCYNAAKLPERSLLKAASLIYHEGMPGHHLQLSRQLENDSLAAVRREPSVLATFAINGYVEGWAEYAAGLGWDLGLYDDPVDAYGRLCSERFQAARLVVDTGMNAFGWSARKAASFLRQAGALPDAEIRTELVRYAVDDPGQALGYHAGHHFLRQLRGNRNLRDFHEAVLSAGPLPLRILATEINALS
ncbi:DUF885 domain-containing protein [Fodinicola acaciae]|uniref:DUF885 domain-containing protein n=1 Tax=Fodinicola acaciae TaxID=2681555 RepID=UPI0013CFDF8A|nr:DUF885 domain-containing protein [Fodinicola acaciae]